VPWLPRPGTLAALAHFAILPAPFARGIDQGQDGLNQTVCGNPESAERNRSDESFNRYGVLVPEDGHRSDDGDDCAEERDYEGNANRRSSLDYCGSAGRGIGIHCWLHWTKTTLFILHAAP